MKTEVSTCKGCGKNKPIVNRTHWLCPECNSDRKSAHKTFLGFADDTETEKTGGSAKTGSAFVHGAKNKPTGELALFNTLWATRKHVSFLSGREISGFNPWNFAHILSKKQFPLFRLYDKNVQLLTDREHQLFDQGTIESRARYSEECMDEGYTCDWQRLFALRDALKEEYKTA